MKSKEIKTDEARVHSDGDVPSRTERLPFSKKLGWLNKLLWGGSALLAFEHLWHGEIMPWFPFLSGASG